MKSSGFVYLCGLMFFGKKKYTKLFFKLLLLVVYVGFFSVQFFLRYASSHSQQSLDFHKHFIVKAGNKNTYLKCSHGTARQLCYLNKRFQPQNAVILPACDFSIQTCCSFVTKKNCQVDSYLIVRKLNAASLRGPPVSLS